MKKNKLQTKGFTLIELMATVAIIGVLAAIAIPNYLKYQRKARQAEAKVLLGSAYLAENSIRQDQHTYSACLGQIGFTVEGYSPSGTNNAQNFYGLGFSDTAADAPSCSPYDMATGTTKNCKAYSWRRNTSSGWDAVGTCGKIAGSTFFPGALSENSGGSHVIPTTAVAFNGSAVLSNNFTLRAVGQVGGNSNDIWIVDENKQIYQQQDGISD
jgi:prepilin-type N-terminal cleavage/methylation domain-containing protein